MPELLPLETTRSTYKGPHYGLIKQTIPDWITSSTPTRLGQLNTATLTRPAGLAGLTSAQHQALQEANADGWRTQNQVDRLLSDIQDVYAFAEPRLKKAIQDKYGLDLNVQTTFLYLYIPVAKPWYVIDFSNGVTTRKVSLLDAALHNFAKRETFDINSCYITQPDYRGHFAVLPLDTTMSIQQFKALCRELDLGAHYQRYLNERLLPEATAARTELQHQVIASQKAALKVAAHLASIPTVAQQPADLSIAGFHLLMRTLRGDRGVMQFYQLSILDVSLSGILLIAADLERVTSTSKLIAYIPHDPESPVKEYDSSLAFMQDLTRKLQTNAPIPSRQQQTYQQFFSQFVDHTQRGHFFANLSQRLCRVQWHQYSPLDPRPSWRETPLTAPRLQFSATPIRGDLWQFLYQQSLNKILNDGRAIAVSTADADTHARWAWWDNFTRLLSDIFNVALMVVTPFVPYLGELMLAYTVFQLTYDAVEGAVDLSEGQFREAGEHLLTVTNDLVQVAAFAIGGKVVGAFKRSPFIDGLQPVQVGDRTRLWNPDLAPYARPELQLPADAQPDALGLHGHRAQKVLRLEGQHYVVEQDETSGTYRIKHPTRAEAYAPKLVHNEHGAWYHEGEDPLTWDSHRLRSRLGPVVQGFDATQLEQACETSATRDADLRMMYADRDSPPPLLVDSLKRIRLRAQVDRAPAQVRAGTAAKLPDNWAAQTTSELPGWPPNKAIAVFINDDLSGHALTYGAATPSDADTLNISHREVSAGQLPERLATFLSDSEFAGLLPAPVGPTSAARIQALRGLLADKVAREKTAVFNHLYSTTEVAETAPGELIQQQFPQLPKNLVANLLLRTSPDELETLNTQRQMPLRLKNLARALANEVRASHASEGLYDDALLTPDTERMVLNILRQHTDALSDISIAIHEQTAQGQVRCQVGAAEAATRKILLHTGPGQYQIHDMSSAAPQPQFSLYEALIWLLPPGKIDYVAGQGAIFKAWLKEKLEPLSNRRTLLQAPTRRQVDERAAQSLLQKPMFDAFRRLFRREPPQPPTLKETLVRLCPSLSTEQIEEVTPHLKTPQAEQLLNTLEIDRAVLDTELENFRKQKPSLTKASATLVANEMLMRGHIIKELKNCWEQGAYQRLLPAQARSGGTRLDLSELTLGRYIASLEPLRADFSHVTRLNVSGTRLGDRDTGFLDNFPNLRSLDLSDNNLAGLPSQLPNIKFLAKLNLSNNPIAWRPSDYAILERCQLLRSLNLEGNTQLRVAPDLSHLPELRRMVLRRTSISAWPAGLDSPKRVTPELDLSNTNVRTVPEFASDSSAARIVANSWLDRTKLERLDEDRFVSYRRAQGIDPYRTRPVGDKANRDYWTSGLEGEDLDTAKEVWDEVEKEHGSQGLFDVLQLLQPPERFQTQEDARLFRQGREDLSIRVWQVLFAVDENPQFRERIFSLAGAPANCADAGAQIFNRIGVETLLENILKDQSPAGLASRESRLATLAKQSWRLDQVNERARAEIKYRTDPISQGGLGQAFGSGDNQVDDVQVYLAYQTGLKARLDLPWLSEHMVYRNTARVTETHLSRAARYIAHQERGNGLVDGMLEQPFWNEYLQEKYVESFNQALEQRAEAGSQLEDLLEAHREWVSPSVSVERKATLRTQLVSLADTLNLAQAEVLEEQPLSDATVNTFYEHIQRDYRDLARRLTRQALEIAAQTS
ncbi:NEL-type E3 ubiquitin ligase domain-containing protein [Pseudomonas rhodesiae]|uniref:NEL-type E3 ubiquitin ligase domain-containing protein n=1 Tax=Pseudomonas rhodesiae TaxID=76760 RepID=UPI0028A89B99|nr:NEL-type E3 ubiquitin ligase domain-containing protein [Pseudomonas rhodesiae]